VATSANDSEGVSLGHPPNKVCIVLGKYDRAKRMARLPVSATSTVPKAAVVRP
jgi:hypothetical protein